MSGTVFFYDDSYYSNFSSFNEIEQGKKRLDLDFNLPWYSKYGLDKALPAEKSRNLLLNFFICF